MNRLFFCRTSVYFRLSSVNRNPYKIQCRYATFGGDSEMTSEQRFALYWREQQKGKPFDWTSITTYIGLFAPLFAFAYMAVQTIQLMKKRAHERAYDEEVASKSILFRPSAITIKDLMDDVQIDSNLHQKEEQISKNVKLDKIQAPQ